MLTAPAFRLVLLYVSPHQLKSKLKSLFHVHLQRFRALTNDSRLSILVTQHVVDEQQRSSGRRIVPTLQAAVDISRYGATLEVTLLS